MGGSPEDGAPEYVYGAGPPATGPPSSGTSPPLSPEPAGAPPAPTRPPPPPSRKKVWVALGAVVVVAVVILAIFVLLMGSNSSTGGSIPDGPSTTYVQAVPLAISEGQAAVGGPWTVVAAEGVGVSNGISQPDLDSVGNSGCTYTPSPGSPSTVTFPGTASNSTPGAVATWVFFAKDLSLDSILLIEVSDGSAVPLVTATGSSCVATFTDLGAINATSVVDSSTIASQLNQGGGTAFLENHTGAGQVLVLLGESAATGGNSIWYLSYTTCPFTATSGTGFEITATYYAATGTTFTGPTAGSQSC